MIVGQIYMWNLTTEFGYKDIWNFSTILKVKPQDNIIRKLLLTNSKTACSSKAWPSRYCRIFELVKNQTNTNKTNSSIILKP